MTLRVAAFTQGENVPSSRFRVQQYKPLLQQKEIELREYPARYGSYPPEGLINRLAWLPMAWHERKQALLAAQEWADVALFQREAISTLATVETSWKKRLNKPAVLDVDDAIWLTQRWKGVDKIAQSVNLVVCGNAFLADHFSAFAPTRVIPTAVDTQRYVPGARGETPMICWSGSASGLPYLQALEDVFLKVFDAVPGARLRVICNQPPAFPRLAQHLVQFIPWSQSTEVAAMQTAWVGVMPMPDTPWTRGKCSYKMLTYMSCGLPTVVSPWGMNREVLAQGEGSLGASHDQEWVDALIDLLHAPAQRLDTLGLAARQIVERNYSLDVLGMRLAQTLKGVC